MIEPLPEATRTAPDPTESGGPRLRRRARSWWWVAVLLAALAGVGVLNAAGQQSGVPLHPRNPGPSGAMAAARILAANGVDIVEAGSLADALAAIHGETTLFVADPAAVPPEGLERLAAADADVVIAGSPYTDLGALTDAVAPTPAGSPAPLTARCADPDATAAGRLSRSIGSLRALRPGVTVCFPTGPDTGAYAVWEQGGRQWRYLADRDLVSNALLAEEGNAALTLRALGQHGRLVWFHPLRTDGDDAAVLPPWSTPVAILLLGVVAALALWQGRRMGRVVLEPLPVVVRPGEAIHGRGRLYRRSRAVAHAATNLRAGTAGRLGQRLGLSRSAGPEALVAAVARATGREATAVQPLLFGPLPGTNAALLELAAALEQLESEAHGVDR